jgi:CcmD family protein
MPALPLHTAGPYVFAAYIVVFTIIIVYVGIMAVRMTRMQRDVTELAELARQRHEPPTDS